MNRWALAGGLLVGVSMLLIVGVGIGLGAFSVVDGVERSAPAAQPSEPAPGSGDGGAMTAAASTSTTISASTGTEFNTTTYQIEIQENGDARWTFRYETILHDTDDEESFEAFADEFESEEPEMYEEFVQQAETLVELGDERTDREMEATEFNRTATTEQRFNTHGVVEMSFTWHGFADTTDDRVIVDDVFDGSFVIASDQSLVVRPADDLVFEEVQPEGVLNGPTLEESDSVTWPGRKQFLDGEPRIVLIQADALESDGSDSGQTDENVQGDSESILSTNGAVAGAALVALLAIAGALGAYRLGLLPRGGPGASGGADQESATGVTTGAGDAEPASPIHEDELMSDEDRVISLIRENGGRMKQVDIVDETGWSKSKVSMLLSDMADEDTISKLRVGRENIISLEGYEPEATKSPFDE